MDTQTPTLPLPPAPETPVTVPPKKKMPRWPFIVGAGLLAAALIAGTTDKAPAATTGTAAAAGPACVNIDSAMNYLEDAQDELTAGGAAVTGFDIEGGADHLDNVSADMAEVADIFVDYPTVNAAAERSSNEFGMAATALRSGSLTQATSYLETATTDIYAASDATEAAAGDITPC